MQLTNDEDIYRYEPVFIDMKGTEAPAHFRYKVIGIWAATLLPWMLLLRLLGGGLSTVVLFGFGMAVATSMFVSLHLNEAHTVGGLLGTLRAEWTAARIAYARARAPRTATVRTPR